MKVQLEKSFPVPATADAAWSLLQDVEAVAGCMPGARIIERVDARHYKGTVSVKLGPAVMAFRGELEVAALDAEARTLRMVGKGTDATGGSGAALDLTARIEAVDAASCRLVGASEISMSGKAAAFGGRMMNAVADQILKQFAEGFAAQAQARQAAAQPAPPPAAQAAQPHAAASQPPPAPPPVPQAKPLNALALVWAMLRDWLRSLFAAKRA
jgi:carbon monoxide dehydrogenase subunit G